MEISLFGAVHMKYPEIQIITVNAKDDVGTRGIQVFEGVISENLRQALFQHFSYFFFS